MTSKLSFCLSIIILLQDIVVPSSGNGNAPAPSYKIDVDSYERPAGDFYEFKFHPRHYERVAVLKINTNFSLQDKSETICRGANVFHACSEQHVKIRCKHDNVYSISLAKNDNFSFATPYTRNSGYSFAQFRLDQNKESTKNNCYFCWIPAIDGQTPKRSEAVIPSYHDCSKNVQPKKVSPTRGSSISLNCWDFEVKPNATIEWYLTQTKLSNDTIQLAITDASKKNFKFEIKNVTDANAGLYHCYIWLNQEPKYRYSRQFELHILERPEAPAGFQCSVTDWNLILNWTQVNTPNYVITYKFEYRRMLEDSAWIAKVLPGTSYNFTLPKTGQVGSRWEYLFRITAVNEAGESDRQVASCYVPD